MKRWFFRVEYDGTAYGGWQVQDNAPSVQAALERAFSTVMRVPCEVAGAGRTDAGVHALGQGAHVDLPDGADISRCQLSVNALLPRDIAVRDFKEVPQSFHARFSALRRRYRYTIVVRKSPLWQGHAWMVPQVVDWKLVAASLPQLLGSHDFTAFCSSNHDAQSMLCNVCEATLDIEGDLRILTIAADRFLYKMVRSIVGTLVDLGRGAIEDSVEAIIASKDRGRVGETAPARGLVLDTVIYAEV